MSRNALATTSAAVVVAFTLACGGLVPPITPWAVEHPGHVEAGGTFDATIRVMSHLDTWEATGGAPIEGLDGLPGLCIGLPSDAWGAVEVVWTAIDADGAEVAEAAIRDDWAEAQIAAQIDSAEADGLDDLGLVALPSDLSWSCWRDRETIPPDEDTDSDSDEAFVEPTPAWEHLVYTAKISVADDAVGPHDLVWAGYYGEIALPTLSLVRVGEPADAFDHFVGARPPHQPPITGIAWGADTFVAVTRDGRTATSADGLDWTFDAPLAERLMLDRVEYGHGGFVAAGALVADEDASDTGDTSTEEEPVGAVLAWSSDGETWSWHLYDPFQITCLRPGVSSWLVCAQGGFGRFDPADPEGLAIAAELDGEDDPLLFDGTLSDVHERDDGTVLAWEAHPLEVATGEELPPTSYHRYDPIAGEWTTYPTPVAGAARVAWGDGRYVAVGVEILEEPPEGVEFEGVDVVLVKSQAAVSSDGITWETHAMEDGVVATPTFLPRVALAYYKDGQFVTVERLATLQTSADGTSWRRHLVGGLLYVQDLARSDDGVWLALGLFGELHRTVEIAAPTLPEDAPPTAHAGVAYTHALTADGGAAPLRHALGDGALPEGLALGADGVLAGIPAASGAFPFTAEVEDSWGRMADAAYTLDVTAPPEIITAALPAGQVGDAYAVAIEVAGGAAPPVWSAEGLPGGIALAADALAGTPSEAGTFAVTLGVTDAVGRTASRTLELVVAAAPEEPEEPQVDAGRCGCAATQPFGAHALLPGLLALLLVRRRRDA